MDCDLLIIGSGIAGLFTAIRASEKAPSAKIIVMTKRGLTEANTNYAQGGIACVLRGDDTFEAHIQDTLTAGCGLCDENVVRMVVEQAPARIGELIDYGVRFTKVGEVTEAESAEGAENPDYVCGIWEKKVATPRDGFFTLVMSPVRVPCLFAMVRPLERPGAEMERALAEKCRALPNVHTMEGYMCVDLITTRRHMPTMTVPNQCLGAYALKRDTNEVVTITASVTVLACGGAGKVYLYTSNPDVATGDGVAMAYRAFADIQNMEMFQFHPTCLYHPRAKNFLVSEAVRGEGARLLVRASTGELVEFMHNYHHLGALAPRDVVSRAIDKELKTRGELCAYLDITHKSETFLRSRFPNIFAKLLQFGINMATDPIPVAPAAHFCCGGVKADINGLTTVTNLYAVGECASTGLHGANRLASNSLLEGVVFAHAAVEHFKALIAQPLSVISRFDIPVWNSGPAVESDEQVVISHNWDEVRRCMWDYVGVFRTNKRLKRAKARIRLLRKEIEEYYWEFLVTPDLLELRNIASVGEMIVDPALRSHAVAATCHNVRDGAGSADSSPFALASLGGKGCLPRNCLCTRLRQLSTCPQPSLTQSRWPPADLACFAPPDRAGRTCHTPAFANPKEPHVLGSNSRRIPVLFNRFAAWDAGSDPAAAVPTRAPPVSAGPTRGGHWDGG
ncbi:putative L-aspartate oxidase 1 [Paratrimastix pyriformis]|uniref:L-aspartate oxidase n=1 Tax=Paratrimastix pyriformis TaxID=342808 RepID=A0ABQ8UG21_9EUKA|nr:putative L-aspartate oxidase 1 [Paratrimastix pyriformis]